MSDMTREERAAEVRRLLTVDGAVLLAEGYATFADVHQRIGELVGRAVYNHELAEPERLAREILTGERPSLDDVLGVLRRHLRPDAQVVMVDPDDPDDARRTVARAIRAARKDDDGDGAR